MRLEKGFTQRRSCASRKLRVKKRIEWNFRHKNTKMNPWNHRVSHLVKLNGDTLERLLIAVHCAPIVVLLQGISLGEHSVGVYRQFSISKSKCGQIWRLFFYFFAISFNQNSEFHLKSTLLLLLKVIAFVEIFRNSGQCERSGAAVTETSTTCYMICNTRRKEADNPNTVAVATLIAQEREWQRLGMNDECSLWTWHDLNKLTPLGKPI